MPGAFTGWGIILEGGEDDDNDGERILDGAPWDGVWSYLSFGIRRRFCWPFEPQAGADNGRWNWSADKRLVIGMWTMAILAWLTVISGTYIVYPWYRAEDAGSPRSVLLANAGTKAWHTFGMEWKEHVGWFAPVLATAAAFIVTYYGPRLVEKNHLRKATLVLFTIAFLAAAVAGSFGAFLNKVAPIR